jgi:hypothetical protein
MVYWLIQGFKTPLTFIDAIYYSVITITTLGCDIVPLETTSRLLAASESIIGIITIGLFLSSLAHERSETSKEEERFSQFVENKRRASVSLNNYSVVLLPLIASFRNIAAMITSTEHNTPYNPNFSLSDLCNLFEPAFLLKANPYEPKVERFFKVQKELIEELVSLIKNVDHSFWPELPKHCHSIVMITKQLDYSEAILNTKNMRSGDIPMRQTDAKSIKDAVDDDLNLRGSNLLDPYRVLALQIKHSMKLLVEIEDEITKSLTDHASDVR